MVLGSTNIDFVMSVKHMAAVGETIKSRSFAKNFGGKGANQAYACGKLGANVTFMSAIGDDDLGKASITNLQSVGVDTRDVTVVADLPSGMAFICVNDDGDNSIVITAGANAACNEDLVSHKLSAIEQCDFLMAQLETPHEGVWRAIRDAYARGKTVILDPAPVPEDGIPDDVYACCTYLTPNETELKELTGMSIDDDDSLRMAAQELLRRGVKNVLVTVGKRGALLMSQSEYRLYPAFAVEPVDTTAAGDTFNAAFASQLACGEAVSAAIRFANAAAALSTLKKGAQGSAPTRDEVLGFLQERS